MDHEILIKSIEKNLDSLESSLNWSLLLILAVIWHGLQNPNVNPTLDLVVLKVQRQYSFLVLGLILSFLHIYMTLTLLRLRDMLFIPGILKPGDSANKEHAEQFQKDVSLVQKILTTIFLHKWPLNPYSFFIGDIPSIFYNNIGHFLFLTNSWAGLTAIYIIAPELNLSTSLVLAVYFSSVALQVYTEHDLLFTLAASIDLNVLRPALFFRIGRFREIITKSARKWYDISRILMNLFSIFAGLLIFILCYRYKGTL